MKRIGWLVILVLAAGPAGAQNVQFNVDCEIGWSGHYRPLQWTPVEVTISSNLKEPFEGVLTVTGAQDEMSTMTIVHKFVLTPDVPLAVPLAAKLAFGTTECAVEITDAAGRPAWRKSYGLWDPDVQKQVLSPASGVDLLIGVSGRMAFGLRHVAKGAHAQTYEDRLAEPGVQASSTSPSTRPGRVLIKERIQRRLPWDWTAYESLDLLILYDPDWTALTEQQSAAIVQWVSKGGKLLIVLGGHPLPAAHPIARMMPLAIGEARQVTLPQATLRAWGCVEAAKDVVNAWPLDAGDAWGWRVETTPVPRAWGPAGFGRVEVLGFDPSVLGGPEGVNLVPFWVEQMRGLLTDRRTLAPGVPKEDENSNRYAYEMDEPFDRTNAVLNFLLDIPEMQPISILWVVLLLAGLGLVIGPVDYFVLKRRDRLPLTWMTFTVTIAVFSLLAYFGVKALRSGQTQVRTVTVMDGVSGQPGAWRCSYSGIFAPGSDDYRPAGLDRGQWWSAIAPHSGPYYYYEGRQRGSRTITCAQQDGSNLPTYVPINIWSMQLLQTECRVPGVPLEVEVERKGQSLRSVVRNLADVPIREGWICVKDEWGLRFGAIPAGGEIRVDGPLIGLPLWGAARPVEESQNDYGSVWGGRDATPRSPFAAADAFRALGNLDRSRAMAAAIARGAAVVCVEYENAPLPFSLADHRYAVVHRQFVRLVVPPKKE